MIPDAVAVEAGAGIFFIDLLTECLDRQRDAPVCFQGAGIAGRHHPPAHDPSQQKDAHQYGDNSSFFFMVGSPSFARFRGIQI